MGGATVVGHVLQSAQEGGPVVVTHPLGRWLLLQLHAALLGGGLACPDHTVDLLQTLGEHKNTEDPHQLW